MPETKEKHISAIDDGPLKPEEARLDVGDRQSVKEHQKDAKQAVATRAETLKWIMSEEKGRKFIYQLLESCHILHNPFNRDAAVMAFSCGEMNIGQLLFTDVSEACPDLYLLMMKEAKEVNNG